METFGLSWVSNSYVGYNIPEAISPIGRTSDMEHIQMQLRSLCYKTILKSPFI